MNDNRLSTNLERINTSVSDMRTTLGATNVSIDTLADMVAENKADLDELENNMVYQVSSRAEMANLTGVEEGTACLVKTMENKAFTKRDKFIKVYFPDKVTLSNPLLEEEEIAIKMDIEGTGHGTLSGTLSSTAFIFGAIIKGQGASAKSITYTAQDNVYTRTDSYGSPIESAGELSWNDAYNFDERLSQFFIVDAIIEETNLYTNGSWVPVNGEETLELKETVTAQAATIVEQVAENSALQSNLDTANATIQQQELTITTQENTITLKDAEIASLNARIEELEASLTPTSTYNATFTFIDSATGEMLPGEEYEINYYLNDEMGMGLQGDTVSINPIICTNLSNGNYRFVIYGLGGLTGKTYTPSAEYYDIIINGADVAMDIPCTYSEA